MLVLTTVGIPRRIRRRFSSGSSATIHTDGESASQALASASDRWECAGASTIRCESVVNSGTTFFVTVPRKSVRSGVMAHIVAVRVRIADAFLVGSSFALSLAG